MTPGDRIEHRITKTVTESDNNLFCLLTMNPHPLHLDMTLKSKYSKIVVVGTYVLSLAVGITVLDLSFNAICNLGYSKVEHLKPVFIGDTLRCESFIISEAFRTTTKVVKVETEVFNQRDEFVLRFHRDILFNK